MTDISELPILDDRYLILETIGMGAYSTVKLGVDLTKNQILAIKIFKKLLTPTTSPVNAAHSVEIE